MVDLWSCLYSYEMHGANINVVSTAVLEFCAWYQRGDMTHRSKTFYREVAPFGSKRLWTCLLW